MGKRHQAVTLDEANQVLDISLVVALAGPTEAVLEQIMRPQLAEDPGAPPVAVAQDPRGRDPGAGRITKIVLKVGCAGKRSRWWYHLGTIAPDLTGIWEMSV